MEFRKTARFRGHFKRNQLVHDLAPWPVVEILEGDPRRYDFILLKSNVAHPTEEHYIRISALQRMYKGYTTSLEALQRKLMEEIGAVEKLCAIESPSGSPTEDV